MAKKVIVLVVIILTAYIMLPFGFGLWNESIGIRGQISFAETPSQTPELIPADNSSEPKDSTDEDIDTSSEIKQSEDVQETIEQESADVCPEIGTPSEPVEADSGESSSPEAVEPVEVTPALGTSEQVSSEAGDTVGE